MYTRRNFHIIGILQFSGGHLVWLTLWGIIAVTLYDVAGFTFLSIPWLPISLVGIATAFYVGFKNNAAYDRLWEARKIWGAIVNDSRSFGNMIIHFAVNTKKEKGLDQENLHQIHQRILYRHIAWLFQLRQQLLKPAPWEHLQGSKMIRKVAEKRVKNWGTGVFDTDKDKAYIIGLLSREDQSIIQNNANPATQLIKKQGEELQSLREEEIIDDFRHMELQKILNLFYTHQGKCERIKNYPLPRQYASMSFVMVGIFIFLLPFGLMPEFIKLGTGLVWLTVPFVVIVGWVFLMMELVGDYSENPFENLGNDIPMYALSRTIEIDLREMLGEKELPPKIEISNSILL